MEFDKVKRFVDEASHFEDALRGMTIEPFTKEITRTDLLDFIWKAKQLAYFYKLNEWNCSDDAVERAAERRAEELLDEMIVEQNLITPEEVNIDEGHYNRGRR